MSHHHRRRTDAVFIVPVLVALATLPACFDPTPTPASASDSAATDSAATDSGTSVGGSDAGSDSGGTTSDSTTGSDPTSESTSGSDTGSTSGSDAGSTGGSTGPGVCDDGWTGPGCDACVVFVHGQTGNDAQSGLTWGEALVTVQAGIDLATARISVGDADRCDVWVGAATYRPGTDRTAAFALAPGVGLYGGFSGTETAFEQRDPATYETILSGDLDQDDAGSASTLDDNAYHVVIGANDAVLDGFTVTAGVADGTGTGQARGGGLYNASASPSVANVSFIGNTAERGGAMYDTGDAAPDLTDVVFSGNTATTNGGAVYNRGSAAPTFTRVEFSDNESTWRGGAMHNQDQSAPTLTDVRFVGNIAATGGGAMHNAHTAAPVMLNVQFTGNESAEVGGAIYNVNSSAPELINATFFDNHAGTGGGAIYVVGTASCTLTNVTIVSNHAGTSGGAMSKSAGSGQVLVRNSILSSNLVGADDDEIQTGGGVSISYSLVQGGQPANVDTWTASSGGDPMLALTPPDMALHPLPGSAAIDAGDSAVAGLPNVDLDGNARVVDGNGDGDDVIDMGAFEYQGN
jgi:predicted outer membrane repeat protein